MHLLFVTSNSAKVNALQASASSFSITITQQVLSLDEPQADTVADVAVAKAQQAYSHLGRACLVEDTGFVVNALNGFPGPYLRYMLATIGIEGLLRLLDGKKERACEFVTALVYVAEDGKQKLFHSSSPGTLAKAPGSGSIGTEWSELARLFVPEGYDATLADLSTADYAAVLLRWSESSVYTQCLKWITRAEDYAVDEVLD